MNLQRLEKTKAVYSALIASVIAWSDERNFFDPKEGATEGSQLVKLVEELGEFAHALARISKPEMRDKIKDGLGDAQVVLINLIKICYHGHSDDFIDFGYVEFMSNFPMEFTEELDQKQSLLSFIIGQIGQSEYSSSLAGLLLMEDLLGFEPGECLQAAYNEIKDRKGKFINRVFVKESDL